MLVWNVIGHCCHKVIKSWIQVNSISTWNTGFLNYTYWDFLLTSIHWTKTLSLTLTITHSYLTTSHLLPCSVDYFNSKVIGQQQCLNLEPTPYSAFKGKSVKVFPPRSEAHIPQSLLSCCFNTPRRSDLPSPYLTFQWSHESSQIKVCVVCIDN